MSLLRPRFGVRHPWTVHCPRQRRCQPLRASGREAAPPGVLFVFGFGYVSKRVIRNLLAASWRVCGACTSAEKAEALRAAGVEAYVWSPDDGVGLSPEGLKALREASHVLSSAPPAADFNRDPVLATHAAQLPTNRWLGYLSSTSVYGEQQGAWVDENSPLRLAADDGPGPARARAEAEWLLLGAHVFRLAGIYGPGRSVVDSIVTRRAATSSQRARDGKRFTARVHVEDIVAVLCASMAQPCPGRVYNVCDDDPAPRREVMAYAEALLRGEEPPPHGASASAGAEGCSAGEKRVRNARIKAELGVTLLYPSYRSRGALIDP